MKKIMQPCGLHCIKMQDIGVTIGEQNILQHVNLHIHCGTLAAVIGKNGAGKSTLIRAILGDIPHTGTGCLIAWAIWFVMFILLLIDRHKRES